MRENEAGTSDDEDLDGRINAWKKGLTAIGAALVFAYFLYFALYQNLPAATDAGEWGAFGDFVGGLLNPIVAFAAFYWLTQSVKLQRRELSETREELKKTTEAQTELVKLAALSGLATAAYSEISRIRNIMDVIERNFPHESDPASQREYDESHKVTLAKLSEQNKKAHNERERYVEQMKALLAKHGDTSIGGEK
ncbi:hypothetical protein [Azonexus sp.]|uniref:hypothetical protein n=1 Tax=Azonexus sp. TaxID=1872668 RepID=UPI0027BA5AC4|nr:hypothetical protein [Azonexus sp.]